MIDTLRIIYQKHFGSSMDDSREAKADSPLGKYLSIKGKSLICRMTAIVRWRVM